MFGRAVYVSQFDGRLPEQCDFYFTSLHIAEEFDDEFAEKAGNMLRHIRMHRSSASTLFFINHALTFKQLSIGCKILHFVTL